MEWLLLGIGALLTIATGFFVAAEFSLITVDKAQVEAEAEAGEAAAQGVLKGLRTLSTQLSGAQVGITITTLLVGFLVEPSLSRLLAGPLQQAGVPDRLNSSVAIASGMAIATLVSMVFGELIPKNLALALPLPAARASVPVNRAFTWLFGPLISVLNGTANAVLRRFGVEPREELSAGRNPEELVALVSRSAQVGTLDTGTATLLTRSLRFSAHTAADVMTPRVRMVSLPHTASLAEVTKIARRTGLSRFPVVESDTDDVIGMVHIKNVVGVPHERRDDVSVSAVMRDVLLVPETLPLPPLLERLRGKGLQFAVVQDEYGGTAGVVTLEDLVEEIVGEVSDEHDPHQTVLRKMPSGSWVIPGMARPDELRVRLGLNIEESPNYETVGGFIHMTLGRIAKPGDQVVQDTGVLTVERMEGRRIERIRYIPNDRLTERRSVTAQTAGDRRHG